MGKAEYGRTQDRTRAINFSSIDEARGLARKLIDRYAKDKYRKNMFEDARVVSASGFSYDEALHPLEYQPSFKPAEPVEKSNNQFSDDFKKKFDPNPYSGKCNFHGVNPEYGLIWLNDLIKHS